MIKKTGVLFIVCTLIFCSGCANSEVLTEADVECPDSPNCVSSKAAKPEHFIEPFTFEDTHGEAMKRLKSALLNEKRTTIVSEKDDYLHAEIRSFIFRFVDDVEFTLLVEEGVIHLRSSSRTGYSDFGVNRRRMERIRKRFQK
ncbi:MAG: DUF1499 domain-containing protein [Proteobacteria bacterium]|nr:DUF1499 domain-containing protein [Pseudomonadota bacterium]NOG61254.1 DUF1499 domain-containing protein [Pseudomonadota bacterium]